MLYFSYKLSGFPDATGALGTFKYQGSKRSILIICKEYEYGFDLLIEGISGSSLFWLFSFFFPFKKCSIGIKITGLLHN